ncbi:MAG: porin [Cellvibrionaceae bacterium]
MKKTILAAALVAAAASAQADTKFYGHVAYNVVFGDESSIPESRDYEFNRHGFSETRFGVNFSKKAGGIKWLALQEYGVAEGEGALDSRRQAFGISGGFGKILFGQYNDVGDGVLHADLAGTALADPMASASAGVVGRITDFGDTDITTDNRSFNVNGFDPGRGEALRYYTPKLGGVVTFGAQLQENEGFEVAMKLNAAGFRLYGFYEDGGDEDGGATYEYAAGALVGYKFAFGLSLTAVASTREDLAGDTIDHSAFKIGYAFGKHKLSYKFQTADGVNFEGAGNEDNREDEPVTSSVAWVYAPAKGVSLYAAVKAATDDSDADNDSGTAFGVGGRVKF